MKWMLYIVVLAAALFTPERKQDVGKLLPVELVNLRESGNTVIIETDTGESGRGDSVRSAILNLKETAPGMVYLDTADYLVITEGAENWVPELNAFLKESVKVCICEETPQLEAAAKYLSAHNPNTRLKAVLQGETPQQLLLEDGCLRLGDVEK